MFEPRGEYDIVQDKIDIGDFHKYPEDFVNEAERIRIYRQGDGLCQECLGEGKSREEALVSWDQYHADHILPWIKGGKTLVENAQVLCSYHNLRKGAAVQ